MPSMFELVYNGDNAFHITVTNFYTINFRKVPEFPIDPWIQIKHVGEGSLQSATILPQYLV